MSYDVYAMCPHCDTTVVELGNYTSNMGPFFRFFDIHPVAADGMFAPVFLEALRASLRRIQNESLGTGIVTLKRRYDDPGGWGSVESATAWLEEMRAKLESLSSEQREKLVIRTWA